MTLHTHSGGGQPVDAKKTVGGLAQDWHIQPVYVYTDGSAKSTTPAVGATLCLFISTGCSKFFGRRSKFFGRLLLRCDSVPFGNLASV